MYETFIPIKRDQSIYIIAGSPVITRSEDDSRVYHLRSHNPFEVRVSTRGGQDVIIPERVA